MAWDHDFCRAAVDVAVRGVLGFPRHVAREAGVADGRCGALAIMQHSGGALNLNVHLYLPVTDPVFVHRGDRMAFWSAPALTELDVAEVLPAVVPRVGRVLARRGMGDADETVYVADRWAEQAPVLAGIAATSVQGRAALGPRAGGRLRLHEDPPKATEPSEFGRSHARQEGFDLHAGVRVPAGARDRLERLSRYTLRLWVAQDRLQLRG